MSSSTSPKFETVLIVLLVLLYSGINNALPTFSRLAQLTPLDLLIGISVLGIVLQSGRAIKRVSTIGPFVVWIIFYYSYGALIATNVDAVMGSVANRLVALPLIAIAVSVTLAHRGSVIKFCSYLQWATIVGSIFAALQSWNLGFDLWTNMLLSKTLSQDDIVSAQVRAFGLMGNANEAGFFFIVGLLLSLWAKGPIAWFGRVAALLGIFLTASRTSGILACVVVLFYVAYTMAHSRLKGGYKVWLLLVLAATVAVAVVVSGGIGHSDNSSQSADEPDRIFSSKIDHLMDLEQRGESKTRQDLAFSWVEKALDGPWYGGGIYSFQADASDPFHRYGAHDIFVAVWGEVGLIGLVLFLLLVTCGLLLTFWTRLEPRDRFVLCLMWFAWIMIGLTWHNQLDNEVATVVWALLFVLPRALTTRQQDGIDRTSIDRR